MLHLKVQFLDDSQKIFVVDVSVYHVLIGVFFVLIIEVIAALKDCMVSDSFRFSVLNKNNKKSKTKKKKEKKSLKSKTRSYSAGCEVSFSTNTLMLSSVIGIIYKEGGMAFTYLVSSFGNQVMVI